MLSPNQLVLVLLHHSGRDVGDHDLHVQRIHHWHLPLGPERDPDREEDKVRQLGANLPKAFFVEAKKKSRAAAYAVLLFYFGKATKEHSYCNLMTPATFSCFRGFTSGCPGGRCQKTHSDARTASRTEHLGLVNNNSKNSRPTEAKRRWCYWGCMGDKNELY